MNAAKKIGPEIRTARGRGRRKSPTHLLLLPIAFGVDGLCCYGLVKAACALAAMTRNEVHGFNSYHESTKTVMVLAFFFAAIPIGLLGANRVAWAIPPVRRFFEHDAQKTGGRDFQAAMSRLLRFTKFWVPVPLLIGLGAAMLGK